MQRQLPIEKQMRMKFANTHAYMPASPAVVVAAVAAAAGVADAASWPASLCCRRAPRSPRRYWHHHHYHPHTWRLLLHHHSWQRRQRHCRVSDWQSMTTTHRDHLQRCATIHLREHTTKTVSNCRRPEISNIHRECPAATCWIQPTLYTTAVVYPIPSSGTLDPDPHRSGWSLGHSRCHTLQQCNTHAMPYHIIAASSLQRQWQDASYRLHIPKENTWSPSRAIRSRPYSGAVRWPSARRQFKLQDHSGTDTGLAYRAVCLLMFQRSLVLTASTHGGTARLSWINYT